MVVRRVANLPIFGTQVVQKVDKVAWTNEPFVKVNSNPKPETCN